MADMRNQMVVGEVVEVAGMLNVFCRNLTVKLEGEALQKNIEAETKRRKEAGKSTTYVNKKERFEFVVENAKVNVKDVSAPTAAEQVVNEKRYEMTKDGEKIKAIRCEKATAPQLFVKVDGGKLKKVNVPAGKTLKGGVPVTVIYKVYEGQYGKQIGVEGVIFETEPELYVAAPRSFGGYDIVADETEEAATPAAEPTADEPAPQETASAWD